MSEEQIISLFSTIGQVLSFRLVSDPDTGRPKGFGFAEFADTDAAASAVRNMNNYNIMGRELRVDFSHVGGKDADGSASFQQQAAQAQQPPGGYPMPAPQTNGASNAGPLPPGVDLPAGVSCPDAISKTLATIPAPQLLDMLSQIKTYSEQNPAYAADLLARAPQLAYAIFQALLLMGLVDTNLLGTVVQQAASTPAGAPLPTAASLPARPATSAPVIPQGYQGQPPAGTPQMYQQGFAPPPQHEQPPLQAQLPSHPQPQQPQGPPDQAALLKQVLEMPQRVVDALPPAERAQIMQLRQAYGVGGPGVGY